MPTPLTAPPPPGFSLRHCPRRSDHTSTIGPHRCWRSDRRPGQSERASTATGLHHYWQSDYGPRWSDCPWNRSWRSDRNPGFMASSSCASSTFVMPPLAAPVTSATPHATTTTPPMPPVALASQHNSCRP
jgi:hypothetical protein